MATPKNALVISMVGLCFLNLIASIDATALSVSLPTIASALNATSTEAYWAGTSFVLSSAVFQPVFAAFSNAFGRKPMVLLALGLFTVGTIVCGTASNVTALLAGRTVQGAGGGGLLTMTYVVMADLLSLRDRAKGLAIISLVWLLGTVCGPVIGGGFTASVTWRWIFWICLPFAGIGIVLIAGFLHTSHQSLHPAQALKKVDWVGAVLLVGSLTGFLIALSWGGVLFAWASWRSIVPLALGAAGLVSWFVYEATVPPFPIVPLVALNNRTAFTAFIGTLTLGIVQFGLLYYLPLYYQVSKGYSPLISGIALWPQCLLSGPVTAYTGAKISKTGKYRLTIWIGWVLLALGCGLLVLLTSETTVPQWIFINAVSGIGLGALFTSQSIATQAATSDEHKAIVSGLTPFFRTIGQALGIVIGDAVFQNTFKSHLLSSGSDALRSQADRLVQEAASLALVLSALPADSTEKTLLQSAFDSSLHAVWWTLFSFAAFAGLLSLLIKQFSLDRPHNSNSKDQNSDVEKGDADGEGEKQDINQAGSVQHPPTIEDVKEPPNTDSEPQPAP